MLSIKNLCCLIITYNPEKELLNLINIVEKHAEKVIVVDNNSDQKGKEILLKIPENDKLIVNTNSENYGIAKALNQGIKLANELGYEWIMTFDQDSKPFKNILEIVSEIYEQYENKNKIGAIGVNCLDENSTIYYKLKEGLDFQERDYLITSGCLLSIKAYNEVGSFREDFFIDNVDLEYSLRLKKHGKILLISRKFGMIHKAGNSKIKKIFGVKIESSNHNSFRRYYMARNHILISREYFFKFPYFILKTNYFFMLSLVKIILVDDHKWAKINATIKGLFDGFFYFSKTKRFV